MSTCPILPFYTNTSERVHTKQQSWKGSYTNAIKRAESTDVVMHDEAYRQYENIGMFSMRSSSSTLCGHPTICRATIPKGPDVPKSIDTAWAHRRQGGGQSIRGARGNRRARRKRRRARGDGGARRGTTLHQGGRRRIAPRG